MKQKLFEEHRVNTYSKCLGDEKEGQETIVKHFEKGEGKDESFYVSALAFRFGGVVGCKEYIYISTGKLQQRASINRTENGSSQLTFIHFQFSDRE